MRKEFQDRDEATKYPSTSNTVKTTMPDRYRFARPTHGQRVRLRRALNRNLLPPIVPVASPAPEADRVLRHPRGGGTRRFPRLPALPSAERAAQHAVRTGTPRVPRNRRRHGHGSPRGPSPPRRRRRSKRATFATQLPPNDGHHAAAICRCDPRCEAEIQFEKGE